jgi:hypothetical protein
MTVIVKEMITYLHLTPFIKKHKFLKLLEIVYGLIILRTKEKINVNVV